MIKKFSVILFLLASLLMMSCATVQQTIYLQDIEVKGPMNPPPVRITKDKFPGNVTISPRLSINKYSEISGNVGNRRYANPSQDSLFRSKTNNLLWKIPQFSFGFDFDVALTNTFGIACGLNYSVIDQTKLIGGSIGIAFFQEKNGNAIRFDAGILVQELYYDAKTIVETTIDPIWGSPSTSVYYYRDKDKNADIDLYATLTYNSAIQNFPFNFFLSASFFTQTILDFEPSKQTDFSYAFILTEKTINDVRGEASSSFLSATPGIFIDITTWSRMVMGVRLMTDIGLDSPSKSFFVIPVLQLDMKF